MSDGLLIRLYQINRDERFFFLDLHAQANQPSCEFSMTVFTKHRDQRCPRRHANRNQKGPIDLVAFVFHLANGANDEDIETMLLVKRNLPLAVKMLLIVSHAEEMDVQRRGRVVEDFFRHPKVVENNLRQCFDEEILFLGSLRYESLQRNDYQALHMEHQNVLAMRKVFLRKCFAHIEQRSVPRSAKSILRYYWPIPFLLLCSMIFGSGLHLQLGQRNDPNTTSSPSNPFKPNDMCFPSDRFRCLKCFNSSYLERDDYDSSSSDDLLTHHLKTDRRREDPRCHAQLGALIGMLSKQPNDPSNDLQHQQVFL